MANVIKTIRTVDEETGEIYYEKKFRTFNGWTEDGYKYRGRYNSLKFYPDNLPELELNVLKVFFAICNIMNEENLLIEKKKSVNKYIGPVITPYTVEDIRENLPYYVSEYSFKKAWQKLVPKYIKKIAVNDKKIWAVNPAFANRCNYVPVFLWNNFKEDMNKNLSETTIRRYKNMLLNEGL